MARGTWCRDLVQGLGAGDLAQTCAAAVEAIKDPQFRERMQKIGVEPVGRASAEADVFFERELVRWKRVIETAGLKLER